MNLTDGLILVLRYGLVLALSYLILQRVLHQVTFDCDQPVCKEKCRSGYTSDGALLCYKNCDGVQVGPALCRDGCRDGYKDEAGVCWERCGGDVDVGALCRKRCRDGYVDVGGVCWERCDGVNVGALCRERCRAGYTDVGGVCWKGLKSYTPKTLPKKSYFPSTYAKKSYVPKTLPRKSYFAKLSSKFEKPNTTFSAIYVGVLVFAISRLV
jgi:hypothetical protein